MASMVAELKQETEQQKYGRSLSEEQQQSEIKVNQQRNELEEATEGEESSEYVADTPTESPSFEDNVDVGPFMPILSRKKQKVLKQNGQQALYKTGKEWSSLPKLRKQQCISAECYPNRKLKEGNKENMVPF
ncbi:hypothetical protein NDU88_002420 [Pleurodeles waltl]|uniref:Uncharacterized protein n=1 Tax=Pleurodeles waltl TaxID=8319 RepID=A0AAV7UVL3_PLEWA|nr:hypothetical protein NDU88_002420 [Pleurodeles waltl]